jgi:hypothetical protein
MVGPISPLMHRFDAILDSTESSWPKIDYIYPPSAISLRAAEKHETHHTDLNTARIGGETLPEPLQLPLWLHRYHLLQHHDEEGVVQPLDIEIVEVTLYQTLSRVHRFRSHELPIMLVTIFILPMWWILCYWDDLWDAKMFMSLMYEYMYILPCSCLLVLITLVC